MTATQIVLLPGMDGTTKLFARFIAAAPPNVSITSVPLPVEPLTYSELADRLSGALPHGKPVIIGESFSGPLALALAERHPVAALVFVNSFVVAPRSRTWRWLARPSVFALRVPHFLLRHYMLGRAVDDALVREVAKAIASVPAPVLASRMSAVLQLDEMNAFSRCDVPTLYLRGTHDRLVPDAAWRHMAACRPITTSHVPGPHMLLQANPLGSWKAIIEFLERLRQ